MNYEKWLKENSDFFFSEKALKELNFLRHNLMPETLQNSESKLQEVLNKSSFLNLLLLLAEWKTQTNKQVQFPNYLSTEEMTQIFGISQRTLAVWRKNKIVEYEVFKKRYFYPLKSILNHLEENRKNIP